MADTISHEILEDVKLHSNGLPGKLAVNNMKLYKGIILVSGSERRLKRGMNTKLNINKEAHKVDAK